MFGRVPINLHLPLESWERFRIPNHVIFCTNFDSRRLGAVNNNSLNLEGQIRSHPLSFSLCVCGLRWKHGQVATYIWSGNLNLTWYTKWKIVTQLDLLMKEQDFQVLWKGVLCSMFTRRYPTLFGLLTFFTVSFRKKKMWGSFIRNRPHNCYLSVVHSCRPWRFNIVQMLKGVRGKN